MRSNVVPKASQNSVVGGSTKDQTTSAARWRGTIDGLTASQTTLVANQDNNENK